MSNIGSIDGGSTGQVQAVGGQGAPAGGDAVLAKLETQLSDWVNCPSGKTQEGKAHIAEINRQIDTVKAQMKKAEEQKAPDAASAQASDAVKPGKPQLRLDGLSAMLDVQA